MLPAKREMEGAEHHLESLKLLLSLHWCNWWSWVSVTLDHLASVGLHGCGVMMAAVHCCDGGPMTAGALRHCWNLERTKRWWEASRLVHSSPNASKEHTHTQKITRNPNFPQKGIGEINYSPPILEQNSTATKNYIAWYISNHLWQRTSFSCFLSSDPSWTTTFMKYDKNELLHMR